MNRSDFLIEPEALAAQLEHSKLRVYDCAVHLKPSSSGYQMASGREDYEQQHIPGAAFLDLIKDCSDTTSGLGFTLPSADALAEAFAQNGIGNEHEVVFYSSGHLMWATRGWWLASFLGLDNIRVLNGGLTAWLAAGLPTSTGDETYPAAQLNPRPRPDRFVRLEEMMGLPAGTCTVNSLSRDMYTGEGDFHYGRPGHIPGSLHLFYDELLDNGRFRADHELRAALDARGMLSSERVVTYCGGGIAATVDGMACLLSGQDNVAVYDGSMSEWVAADQPLTTGSEA